MDIAAVIITCAVIIFVIPALIMVIGMIVMSKRFNDKEK